MLASKAKKITCRYSLVALAAVSVLVIARETSAADFTWSAASGSDLFWLTPGNWSPGGPPGTNAGANFFESGVAADGVTPTVVVTADATVEHIWVGHTNSQPGGDVNPAMPGAHNFVINAGVTLAARGTNHNGYGLLGSGPEGGVLDPLLVQSTYYVGTKKSIHRETTVTNNVLGEGTLLLDNPNNELNVRQIIDNNANSGDDHWAVLDMTGLNNFVARLGRIRVGDGESEPIRRASGIVWLAKTNSITLTGINSEENVQLVIGNNDVNNNGSRISELILGQVNDLNIEEILVGGRKTIGRLRFDPELTSPTLRLRGSDGSGRVGKLRIGDHADQPNTGNNTQGFLDLTGGIVDMLVDTVYVGRSSKGGTGPATGTFTLGEGTLDANNIEVAFQTTDLNTTSTATGTMNVNGTTVVANNLLRLGRSAGSPTARTANLNINGGSVTVNGQYKNEGTANISITDGYLSLPAGSAITANMITLNNGAISNAASLTVTNGLSVGAGSVIAGNPVFNLGNDNVGNFWDVAGLAGGLVVNQSLSGVGNVNGNVTLSPGATVNPGGTGRGGTLTFNNDLTNQNSRIAIDLTTNAFSFPASDQLAVLGTLVLNGMNDVLLNNIGPTLDTTTSYPIMTYTTLSGSAANLRAAGRLGQSRFTFTFDTATQPGTVLLNVDLAGAASLDLTWVGDGAANAWDFTSQNWNAGGPTRFFNLDSVTFDDSGSASPNVNLADTVSPGSLTVANPTKNYVFSGPGGIEASVMNKLGNASLTLTNDGDNRFTGPVGIGAGAVMFANDGLNTFGGGVTVSNGASLTWAGNSDNVVENPGLGFTALTVESGASLTIANANANSFSGSSLTVEGTLTFDQAVDAALDGSLTSLLGTGTLIKQGAGTLAIAGANGLSTALLINGGTVQAVDPGAIGFAGATVANGAALDIRGQSFAATITLGGDGPSGGGALISTGPGHEGAEAVGGVMLTSDTTFGGVGPWDTDPVKNTGRMDLAAVNTSGQARKIKKVGSNQLTLKNALVDPALGDIEVQAGAFLVQGSTDGLGNPANLLSVSSGATLAFFDTDPAIWNKQFVLNGNGVVSALFNWSGTNTLAGSMTISGNIVLDDGRERASSAANQQLLNLNCPIGGSGGFTKVSVGTTVLNGNNTYTGDTIINGGVFLVNGNNSGSGAVTVNGGTLGGTGAISGPVTIAAGGTVSPGASLGTLSIANTLSLSGTTAIELDKTGSTLTSDLITNVSTLTLGGTLHLTLTGDPLAAGDSFRLFSFNSAGGAFAAIVPETPGEGLVWNTSTLTTDGRLRVSLPSAPQPRIVSARLTGTDLVVSGTDGPNSGDYYVLAGTNVAQPIATWERIATNSFTSGSFSFTTAVNSGTPQRYFLLQLP